MGVARLLHLSAARGLFVPELSAGSTAGQLGQVSLDAQVWSKRRMCALVAVLRCRTLAVPEAPAWKIGGTADHLTSMDTDAEAGRRSPSVR